MDALTYTNFQNTFATKARRASDAEVQGALDDIRKTLAMDLGGYVNPVSGLTDYQTKLFLERDEFLAEKQRRAL